MNKVANMIFVILIIVGLGGILQSQSTVDGTINANTFFLVGSIGLISQLLFFNIKSVLNDIKSILKK